MDWDTFWAIFFKTSTGHPDHNIGPQVFSVQHDLASTSDGRNPGTQLPGINQVICPNPVSSYIEILILEWVSLRWSSKPFWQKNLVKSLLISTLDKVIYYKGTFLQGSTKPHFTIQKRLETSWKNCPFFNMLLLRSTKISMTSYGLGKTETFWQQKTGPNPTIASYNARAAKIYNAMNIIALL
jgi:hypothetical protein